MNPVAEKLNPRQSDAQIRLVPNESVWAVHPARELGLLVGELIDCGREYGVTVELDSSDRTRLGEQRGGASPIEGFVLVIAAVGVRELARLADAGLDAVVRWVRSRRRPRSDPTHVVIYGPDDKPLREVYIDDQGVQPVSKDRREN